MHKYVYIYYCIYSTYMHIHMYVQYSAIQSLPPSSPCVNLQKGCMRQAGQMEQVSAKYFTVISYVQFQIMY